MVNIPLKNSDISRFWWRFCEMYGEVNTSSCMEPSILEDYISNAKLGVCLKVLEHQIDYVRDRYPDFKY